MPDSAVVRAVDALFSSVRQVSGERELRVVCPECEHRKQKCYINSTTGLWHCKHCGAKGNLFQLCFALGQSLRQVLAGIGIVPTPAPADWASEIKGRLFGTDKYDFAPMKLPDGFVPIASHKGVVGQRALDWLNRRDIDLLTAERYGIGYCMSGEYIARMIVPVFDGGELVYFVARQFIGAMGQKYMNPPLEKASVIFGIGEVSDAAIICEGVFDAIAVGAGGVAIFGKSMSLSQVLRLLATNVITAVILLDADADEQASMLADQLCGVVDDVRIATLPGGDPASVGSFILREAIINSTPQTRFSLMKARLDAM